MRAVRGLCSSAKGGIRGRGRPARWTEVGLSRFLERNAGEDQGTAMKQRFLNRNYQRMELRAQADHHLMAPELVDIELQLTPPEERMVTLLQRVVEERNLKSTLRIAGGWVRDKLLEHMERMSSAEADLGPQAVGADIDIAIDNMMGMEFAAHLSAHMQKLRNERLHVGLLKKNPERSKHLETANVKVDSFSIDFVNLRTEKYAVDSRTPIMEMGTPYEDAIRRDLTINTLFYNLETRRIEDFVGTGFRDLQDGVIDTPLAPVTTFKDDPLRVLRAIRFTARLGFKFSDRLYEAATNREVQQALLRKVSAERVGHEIESIVQCVGDSATRHSKLDGELSARARQAFSPKAMATTATTKPTAHEEESSDRLVEATSKILGEREGCGRVLTGVKLLHKVEILRMLFRFESIYVPTALEAISVKDCEWEAIPDAIVGCVAGLDALLRFRGEKPEDRIWRANAGADKATLRRVMLSLLCVPFYDPRGPIAAALPEGSLAAQTRLLSEPITEKLGLVGAYEVDLLRRPGKNCKRSASESNDVGVYFITNTLKRGRKDGQLADKCALGAVSAAVQGLLDDDTDRDRFNVALALREIGEAWPICLLVGGALRISQLCREGASLEDAAESVGRNLDAGVQWMMAERLVPTVKRCCRTFSSSVPSFSSRRFAGNSEAGHRLR